MVRERTIILACYVGRMCLEMTSYIVECQNQFLETIAAAQPRLASSRARDAAISFDQITGADVITAEPSILDDMVFQNATQVCARAC